MRPTWIRVYGDLLSDSTIQRWSPGLRYCWVGALLIAAQSPEPGVLVDDSRTPLAVADLGELLHVSWDTAHRFQERALEANKLLRLEDTGALAVKNFTVRQGVDEAVETSGGGSAVVAEIARESLGNRPIIGTGLGPLAGARDYGRSGSTAEGSQDSAVTAKAEPSLAAELLVRGSGLPFSEGRGQLIRDVAARLADADARTAAAIESVARGLPEAALHTAMESLEERRRRRGRAPLVSEARYFVATLQRMRGERQYA